MTYLDVNNTVIEHALTSGFFYIYDWRSFWFWPGIKRACMRKT